MGSTPFLMSPVSPRRHRNDLRWLEASVLSGIKKGDPKVASFLSLAVMAQCISARVTTHLLHGAQLGHRLGQFGRGA